MFWSDSNFDTLFIDGVPSVDETKCGAKYCDGKRYRF